MSQQLISSHTPWESSVGYSRAVRVGDQVFVAGTTASNEDGTTAAIGDPFEQTRFIFRKIEVALLEAGACLADVVRTRMFVTDINHWQQVGQAHGEVFAEIRPASTLVEVSRLISPDHLVEIEVDAIISRGM
ncbi:MAG: RidA family protein [Planctomycetota bacterium]|nr:RidA family protein [Planctomycetota bacterium]